LIFREKWIPYLKMIEEKLSNLPGFRVYGISERKDELFEKKFEEMIK
jgi:hypothetical protein